LPLFSSKKELAPPPSLPFLAIFVSQFLIYDERHPASLGAASEASLSFLVCTKTFAQPTPVPPTTQKALSHELFAP
jgi:hypothetical protein